MNSPIDKNIMSCMQCEQYKKELEEKDSKIKILENNILKIKSLLSESGSLIDGYNEIMEENKNLKSEIENLKNDINLHNNNNYQFELLKQKMLRYQQENQELKAVKQFYESQKVENLNHKDANETKIKRELSQKDKEINQLNTVISLLKRYNNDQKLSNDEIIKKYSKNKINSNNNNNSIIDEDEMLFMENDNNNNKNNIDNKGLYNNNENNYKYNGYNTGCIGNNNFKMIDLYKEKEFLSEEYQKYKQKYIVYKFKYHEFKKTTKLFLNYMKVIPSGFNFSSFFENINDKKSFNLIGTKRIKSNNDKEEGRTTDNLYNNINAIRNININNQIRKKSEETNIFKLPSLFNNTFNDNEDYSEEGNIKIVVTEESEKKNKKNKNKNLKKKSKKKKSSKKTNISIREEEEEEQSNKSDLSDIDKEKEKEKENKLKKEPKKRGRKPKKEKEKNKEKDTKKNKEVEKIVNDSEEEEKEEEEIKENKDNKDKKSKEKEEEKEKDKKDEEKNEKEKPKDDNKENEKEKEIKELQKHIDPIPKNIKKKIDPIEQKTININNLLNLLSNTPEKITKDNLNSILSLQNTIHEKTSFLFEIILSNIIKLELSRVLSLFEIFIDINQESKTIIGVNILENINLNLNTNSLLSKKNHLKIANKSNETYKNYINKNFSLPVFLISFLIDILYRKLDDISSIANFLYQLTFDKNIDEKNKQSILIILINTIKENKSKNITNNKLYFKEEQLNKYLSKENENKFYFFLYYKNNLISEKIMNLIILIYSNKQNDNYDTDIINYFNNLFNNIPDDKELKIEVPNFIEEYKSSIKFNTDIIYLEIFQALSIIIEIKEIKWIYENIFTNLFWNYFQKSKKDNLKRALTIYYSSFLFYLCLKNGIKNHSNENLLEQQEFSRLYGWLYSIYNIQPQYENLIGFYEKLCALSWIVESPIMTMSTKVFDTIKEVINNIVNGEKESLCPTDFLDKLKKLKLFNVEF